MATTMFKGIVLNSMDYEDYDRIITVYSDKYGKIGMIALGVNKPTSKNKYALQTFNLAEFEIFKSRQKHTLSKLKTAILIQDHFQIAQNYDNYLYASAIGKIIDQATQPRQKNYRLYRILCDFLEVLNLNQAPLANFIAALVKILHFFGGNWVLNQCYRCFKTYKVYRSFSFQDYGLVCPNCVDEADQLQDVAFINHLISLKKPHSEQNQLAQMPIKYLIFILKHLLIYYEQVLGIWNPILAKIEQKDYLKNFTTM
ncbi:DNA repair protein RecO [Williamsoniiplasma lucivorax]|uniref:DNA repair protein RecO n=1 Tax=Williamsoniiplasma lucivorax TaxID=209274 RepID=A0A2S5RCZ2_9MOLU|nr:DNA repair protein RecO [Williamsoniiplasma lucivorax]PPE05199.1 DNA repair protein recO [Williamsoniiplasma lucivorax]